MKCKTLALACLWFSLFAPAWAQSLPQIDIRGQQYPFPTVKMYGGGGFLSLLHSPQPLRIKITVSNPGQVKQGSSVEFTLTFTNVSKKAFLLPISTWDSVADEAKRGIQFYMTGINLDVENPAHNTGKVLGIFFLLWEQGSGPNDGTNPAWRIRPNSWQSR